MTDPLDANDAVSLAKPLVRWPAIGLIATGFISLILAAVGLFSIGSLPQMMQTEYEKIEKDPGLSPAKKQEMIDMLKGIEKGIQAVAAGQLVLVAVGAVIVIVGGFKLKNLTSAGWAKTASVMAMIPFCVSYSCLLGLPFGVWAFVAMGKPQVKAAFAARKRAPDPGDDLDSRPSAV